MKRLIEILIVLVLLVVLVFIGRDKLAAFYYNQGDSYYERHLYKKAVEYFSKSLSMNPNVAVVHYGLANAYLDGELEDRAIEEYKNAIQLDKSLIWAYKALANIYLKRALYQDAMNTLIEAENYVPGNPEIKELMNFISNEYVAQNINSGTEALMANDHLKARESLGKALKINPNNIFANYLLGYFYYEQYEYDKAEQVLKKVIFLDNKFYLAHSLLGDIYFKKNDFNRAIAEYEHSANCSSDNSIVFNNIGLAYMNLERYDEAIPFLKKAVDLNPTNVNMQYSLASVYRDSGRSSEAVMEYKKVVNMQPGYPNIHNSLGDIYIQQGLIKDAYDEYRKEIFFSEDKISANPNDPFVLVNMAHAYNGIKEYAKAKELIDKALTIKSDYQEGYLTLSSIYMNLGNPQEALNALEKSKGLSPKRTLFMDAANVNTRESRDSIGSITEFDPKTIVYLKNGRKFEGIVKRQDKDNVILEIKSGNVIGTVTLPQDNIERIASIKD